METQTAERIELDRYLAKIPEDRKTTFSCPGCDSQIGTIKPRAGEKPYDTFSTCPDCGVMFFKVVDSDGIVTVQH